MNLQLARVAEATPVGQATPDIFLDESVVIPQNSVPLKNI
jgi:hypothetical protein